MKDLLKELNSIFINVFKNDNINFQDTLTQDDISTWDSLNHLNLIIEICERFNIKLTPDEIDDMKSVKNIIRIIEGKIEK